MNLPLLKGTVTKLIKKRDGTVFGLETNTGEFLYSWPDRREEPFEADKVKVGSTVEGTWMPFEKDGKTTRYLSILSVTGQDVTPERGEGAQDESDGQYRSPKDFRRTSALAQAVARHTGAISMQEPPSDEDIILTAQRFEIFLASGT